ncbi:PREDICTED: defensin-like protein 206 [Camelina sativa]|uniref:Defensin-like protein 206 n=1 Tax=Camelina sativa TaxID=90675 RepID=A0ABM0ZF03_CAMSA|nr:PREDICTED: defensin-like protein 206 [Camelina sativa]XP_010514832.1 PREDICTED: defensin-like protein 206 [Camelina sativa]XP_010514833.1 PREDICTED: defensin-like protein 206 [Camelina sativa]
MAKNINSVCFTVLLVVFIMATTEILKSDAAPACFTFLDECGPDPFPGTNVDCTKCCRSTYKGQHVCKGVVEGSENHCHCYQRTKKE